MQLFGEIGYRLISIKVYKIVKIDFTLTRIVGKSYQGVINASTVFNITYKIMIAQVCDSSFIKLIRPVYFSLMSLPPCM